MGSMDELINPGVTFAQSNNALAFPGLRFGVTVTRAGRISDGMTTAAVNAAPALPDASRAGASLLPPMTPLRKASAAVGVAVAHAAMAEGLNRVELTSPIQPVHDAMWQPDFPTSTSSTDALAGQPGPAPARTWTC